MKVNTTSDIMKELNKIEDRKLKARLIKQLTFGKDTSQKKSVAKDNVVVNLKKKKEMLDKSKSNGKSLTSLGKSNEKNDDLSSLLKIRQKEKIAKKSQKIKRELFKHIYQKSMLEEHLGETIRKVGDKIKTAKNKPNHNFSLQQDMWTSSPEKSPMKNTNTSFSEIEIELSDMDYNHKVTRKNSRKITEETNLNSSMPDLQKGAKYNPVDSLISKVARKQKNSITKHKHNSVEYISKASGSCTNLKDNHQKKNVSKFYMANSKSNNRRENVNTSQSAYIGKEKIITNKLFSSNKKKHALNASFKNNKLQQLDKKKGTYKKLHNITQESIKKLDATQGLIKIKVKRSLFDQLDSTSLGLYLKLKKKKRVYKTDPKSFVRENPNMTKSNVNKQIDSILSEDSVNNWAPDSRTSAIDQNYKNMESKKLMEKSKLSNTRKVTEREKEPLKVVKNYAPSNDFSRQEKVPWPRLKPSVNFIPESKAGILECRQEWRNKSDMMSNSTEFINGDDENKISPEKKMYWPKLMPSANLNMSNKKASFINKSTLSKSEVKCNNTIKTREADANTPLTKVEINYNTKQPLKRESEKKAAKREFVKRESIMRSKIENDSKVMTSSKVNKSKYSAAKKESNLKPKLENDSNVMTSSVVNKYLTKKNKSSVKEISKVKEITKREKKMYKSDSCPNVRASVKSSLENLESPFFKSKKVESSKPQTFEKKALQKDDGISMTVSNLFYGIRYEFVNTTNENEYFINMTFKLKNCGIQNTKGNYIKILVAPKSKQTVELNCISKGKPWQSEIAHVDFKSVKVK